MPSSPWDAAPQVQRFADACPYCRAIEHIRLRTYNFGDGSFGEKRVCRHCSNKFWLVREPYAAPIGQNSNDDR